MKNTKVVRVPFAPWGLTLDLLPPWFWPCLPAYAGEVARSVPRRVAPRRHPRNPREEPDPPGE
jgi:hypothetical protein